MPVGFAYMTEKNGGAQLCPNSALQTNTTFLHLKRTVFGSLTVLNFPV